MTMTLVHTSTSAFAGTAEIDRNGVRLHCGELVTHLHPLWLRDRSTEPGQIDPSNRQRLFTPRDVAPDLTVKHCQLNGDRLTVAFSDGHVAHLSVETIGRRLGWFPDPEEPPMPEPWIGTPEPFPFADWATIGWSDEDADLDTVVDALAAFYRTGFVVFRGTPLEENTVARVAERMGYLVGQNFGRVFDVRVEPDPTDLAYTSIELLAHTDLPYRREPPGIQLLHCLANEAPGGDSTMVDGLAAWYAVRVAEPEMYGALADVEVEYRYDIGADTVVNRGHVLEVDRDGKFRSIRFNTKLDEPSPHAGADLDAWYRGRRWLTDWLNDPSNRARFRLEAGDLLFLDNHRVLHGRTAFNSDAGRRHLQGCYLEHDGPDTMYRLARRRLAASS
jgi:gamma-butyrobetaine dioxygenase